MALTPKLEIRQSQSLLMTPQLRQAINLLQLSNTELSSLIEEELSKNPLLERESDAENQPDNFQSTIDDSPQDTHPDTEDFSPDNIDYDSNFDDFGSDTEGYQETNYDWTDYNRSKNLSGDEDFDYCEQKLSSPNSIYDLLDEQITLHFTSVRSRIIAHRLCDFLDEAGYFRGNIADIAIHLKTSEEEILKILSELQKFEPSGLFARNLQECLKIQLADLNRLDPMMEKLLENLPLLGAKKYKELQKICKADADDIRTMIQDIQQLNPKPLSAYTEDKPTYIIPDVFIKQNKHGIYRVELNPLSLPKVLINHEYCSQINAQDKSSKRFIKENMAHASFLIKAMHQRATTILRVSEEILRQQIDFFEKGIEYLKPLSLKDVAYNLEMHESTVSRVTSHKYMHTPCGQFELKFFFSQAAGSYVGNEETSTITIKHKIKQLIEQESAENILSDDNIVGILGQEGIKIARRTVAKYREAEGLPTSAERKRQKRG